jgi:hypothetical protein
MIFHRRTAGARYLLFTGHLSGEVSRDKKLLDSQKVSSRDHAWEFVLS